MEYQYYCPYDWTDFKLSWFLRFIFRSTVSKHPTIMIMQACWWFNVFIRKFCRLYWDLSRSGSYVLLGLKSSRIRILLDVHVVNMQREDEFSGYKNYKEIKIQSSYLVVFISCTLFHTLYLISGSLPFYSWDLYCKEPLEKLTAR